MIIPPKGFKVDLYHVSVQSMPAVVAIQGNTCAHLRLRLGAWLVQATTAST